MDEQTARSVVWKGEPEKGRESVQLYQIDMVLKDWAAPLLRGGQSNCSLQPAVFSPAVKTSNIARSAG